MRRSFTGTAVLACPPAHVGVPSASHATPPCRGQSFCDPGIDRQMRRAQAEQRSHLTGSRARCAPIRGSRQLRRRAVAGSSAPLRRPRVSFVGTATPAHWTVDPDVTSVEFAVKKPEGCAGEFGPIRLLLSLLPEAAPCHDPGAEEREHRDEHRGRNGRAFPVIAAEFRVGPPDRGDEFRDQWPLSRVTPTSRE